MTELDTKYQKRRKIGYNLAPETIKAVKEMKRLLRDEIPQFYRFHSQSFCVELAIHHALGSIRDGRLTVKDFFETPVSGIEEKDDIEQAGPT